MFKIKKTDRSKFAEDMENWSSQTLLVGMQSGTNPFWKTVYQECGRGMAANEHRRTFEENRHVLKLDWGNGCTIVYIIYISSKVSNCINLQ